MVHGSRIMERGNQHFKKVSAHLSSSFHVRRKSILPTTIFVPLVIIDELNEDRPVYYR